MSEPTYGQLLATAERHLVRAALASRDRLPDTATARNVARAHARLVGALRANLRAFGPKPVDHEITAWQARHPRAAELARALDAFVDPPRDTAIYPRPARLRPTVQPPSGGDWGEAARALQLAAETLTTHLGPYRAHRTPDGVILDDPAAQHAAIGRLAEIALTVGVAQKHLALRVRELADTGRYDMWLRAAAHRMLATHEPITVAAAGVLANRAGSEMPGAVAALQAAPLLRPTRGGDPITAARQSFDRIRLIAHRQARGELPAGIDAIRAHATAATLVAIHAHAVTAAGALAARRGLIDPSQAAALEQRALSLRDARAPWAAVAVAAERYASTRRSPRLLAHEMTQFAERLAEITRSGDKWREPEDLLGDARSARRLLNLTSHMSSRLSDLATATTTITERLHLQKDVFMQTRDRDDIDHPYRWAPFDLATFSSLQYAVQTALPANRTIGADVSLGPTPYLSVVNGTPPQRWRLKQPCLPQARISGR